MKIIALILLLFLSNCSTPEKVTKFNPSINTGCSKVIESKERLLCISKMIKQLEDIRNSKIIITEKENIKRIDQRYSLYRTTYCFSDQDEKEKYLCFESEKEEYDPTLTGIIIDYSVKIGGGFVIGFVTGVGVVK
jgi:predicted small secreted protein